MLVLRVGHRATLVLLLLLIVLTVPGMASAGQSREISPSEAIERAVENDFGLCQARLGLSLAVLELRAAKLSLYLPTVGFALDLPDLTNNGPGQEIGASLTASIPVPWGSGSVTGGVGFSYNASTSELVAPTWNVSLSEILDLAHLDGRSETIHTLQQTLESAERSYRTAHADLVISTIRTYGDLLSEAQQAEQDLQTVDRLTTRLGQIEELAAQGYKGELDVNEARLLVLEAEVRAEKSAAVYATDLEAFGRETLGVEEPYRLSPFTLSTGDLVLSARALLAAEIPTSAISDSSTVIAAQQGVADAEDALREARVGVLPSLSVEAAVSADEWRVGLGLSLDLFDPERGAEIEIAKIDLELAQEKLGSARETVRNAILSLKSSLLSAVRSAESLTLETEAWQLEEQVKSAKRDAGSLSDSDWAEFLEEKGAFGIEAASRSTSLLVAHLAYRNALGMELDWEEWL
ncbi:MAG: TolC family protein [Candidatus Bipolaricaulis sp.]|nr:TolC family protein [Candidatus Bipolaricaulis sp.]MDD5645562.1 TolC family protein [Candidatus Bipolaricaulis sp.]